MVAKIAGWVTTTTYLRRWLVLGSAIGLIAGLGAIVFYDLLGFATHVLLRDLVGYSVPTPAGEGFHAASRAFERAWALPLVVGAGGLVSGLLVFGFAPEAEGHGTDAAIEAVHENPRGIRARAVAVKIIASAVTIGSGGSAGREGPTAQISAGFASLLSRLLNLSPGDARIAVSTGVGSGIGAIFKAPLGGAVLAMEILYRDDMEPETFLPALIASIVSYAVFGAAEGFEPLFATSSTYRFSDPPQLLWFALIGSLCGLVGLLYARGFYGLAGFFSRLPLPRAVRPAIGGLLVGLMALGLPEVLGTGYGWVQEGLQRHALLGLPLAAVLLLPFARIVATGFSIGSGGSGGIFGPGMVIGAFVGAAVWRLFEPIAPAIPHDPAPFVIIGMMACFGSISRAPLAIMVMVVEMTASLEALAPAMLAVGIATLIVRRSDATIYRSQRRTRNDSPAHRLQLGMTPLAEVRCADVMHRPRLLVRTGMAAGAALGLFESEHLPGAPVVNEDGIFVGTVAVERLGRSAEQGAKTLDPAVDPTAVTVQASAALDTALEALTTTPDSWVTVLDSGQRPVGIVTTATIVNGYRRAVETGLRRLAGVSGGARQIEVRVGDSAPATRRPLRAAGLPRGTVVLTIERDGGLFFPDAATVLEPGDLVTATAPAARLDEVRVVLEGEAESGGHVEASPLT
jgi:CIC family chloride channel protein